MNFDQVRQEMTSPEAAPAAPSEASVNTESTETQSSHTSDMAPESNQPSMAELEKLERFKFDGQEWTPKDLKNSILRHNDYTRKTQELAESRKSVETEQLYRDNFKIDFEKVLQSPELMDTFRQFYPKHWVDVAEKLLEVSKAQQPAQQPSQSQTQQGSGLDPKVMQRIDYIEKTFQQREVEALEKTLDSEFTKLGQKYPNANQELVLARAQLLSDQKIDILKDGQLEQIFKNLHDSEASREKQWRDNLLKEQKTANTKGRDIGKGGGTPGKAPEKMSFKDARQNMMDRLGN